MTKETLERAYQLKKEITELEGFLITLRNIREMEISQLYKKTFLKTIPYGYWKEELYIPSNSLKEKIYSTLEKELELMKQEMNDL